MLKQLQDPSHHSTQRKSTRFEGTWITNPVRHGKVRVVEDVLHRLLHVVDLGAVPWEEVPPVVDVTLGLSGGTVMAMHLQQVYDLLSRAVPGMVGTSSAFQSQLLAS